MRATKHALQRPTHFSNTDKQVDSSMPTVRCIRAYQRAACQLRRGSIMSSLEDMATFIMRRSAPHVRAY